MKINLLKRLGPLHITILSGSYPQIELGLSLPFSKCLELAIRMPDNWDWFGLLVRFSRRCDHAGLNMELTLGRIEFDFEIRDLRHWNDKANRYYYDNENQED